MICPGNPEHRGIAVVLMDKRHYDRTEKGITSPHYAKAVCAECRVWIKWLSKAQADDLDAANDLLESDIGMGMREEGAEFSEKELEQIREIVIDEIKRLGVK